MGESTTDGAMSPPMLQSKDHGQLLDIIDSLRSLGIDRHVPLPQLVVCGDQSSGKSSVLEAISGVRFPTKDTLCTRFATELILRRDAKVSVDVSIRPGDERSDEEKTRLQAFKAPTTNVDEFPELVEAAKDAMGLSLDVKRFSDDILRIELSGPNQPHLTLVDLPGLFHSGNTKQTAEDAKMVKALVQSYMASKRSIILAVVSAKNDYANQLVTDLALEFDPKSTRTLGIITKPDTLIVGSDSEKSFIGLAKNEDVVFRLGWHALRNRDFDTKSQTTEQRDREEEDFFSRGIWTSLPAEVLGVKFLKPRLSNVLRDQITSVLPSLIEEVETGIQDCESRLARLGKARQAPHERRLYLVQISQTFSNLIKAAVDGVYVHDFFGDVMTAEGYEKRLRAVIQNHLLQFAEDMRLHGKYQVIINDTPHQNVRGTNKIHRSDYLDHVRDLMRRSRGRELPGTFNPLIIGDLFFQQSQPWENLAESCCQNVLEAVQTSLHLSVNAAADPTTSEGLLNEVLYPAIEGCSKSLQTKLAEILEPHQKGHPITYNHYFTETIQEAREAYQREQQLRHINEFFGCRPDKVSKHIEGPDSFNTGKLASALGQSSEKEMDRYACSEATHCMEAYYKVAMKVLVDNFGVLAVENCIMKKLTEMLSPEIVMKLDDSLVDSIASETEASQVERKRTVEKLGTLNEGLAILNRFSRQHLSGLVDPSLLDQNSDSASRVHSPEPEEENELVEEAEEL